MDERERALLARIEIELAALRQMVIYDLARRWGRDLLVKWHGFETRRGELHAWTPQRAAAYAEAIDALATEALRVADQVPPPSSG